MKKFAIRLLGLAIAFSSVAAFAAQGDIVSVYIQTVSVVTVAFGGHQAGDMEIRILNGFTMPAGGVSCDSNYITTLKANDPDKKLFALLSMAQATKMPVSLRISDDPSLAAVSGRCSLLSVVLGQ